MNHNPRFNNSDLCSTDDHIDNVRLSFDPIMSHMVERPKSGPSIKGPIPIAWLSQAASLSWKSLNVALAILGLSGMNENKSFKLFKRTFELFRISCDATNDALTSIHVAGLIHLKKEWAKTADQCSGNFQVTCRV